MAGTLLDAVRNNAGILAGQTQPVTGQQTGQAANLLSAKSGKAAGGPAIGGYGMSSLGEQSAAQQANTTMQTQVRPQAEMQNQQLGIQQQAQQQATGQALGQIGQQRQFNNAQTRTQTTALLNDLERQSGQISQEQKTASVNQIATNLRLQNSQYVNNLTIEGQKARLDNQLSFQQNLAKSMFGDRLDILNQQLGNKSVLDASQREFSQAMANMDINTANELMSREIAASQQRAAYGSIGGLVTAGIGAYANMDKTDTTTTPSPGTVGTGTAGAPMSVGSPTGLSFQP